MLEYNHVCPKSHYLTVIFIILVVRGEVVITYERFAQGPVQIVGCDFDYIGIKNTGYTVSHHPEYRSTTDSLVVLSCFQRLRV